MITLSSPRGLAAGAGDSHPRVAAGPRVGSRGPCHTKGCRARRRHQAVKAGRPQLGTRGLTISSAIDVAIIEDDADYLRWTEFVLGRAGCTTATAADIQNGLALVLEARPKVLLCDFNLPDGTGGTLCTNLRRNADVAATYCILMSAASDCDLPAEVLKAGADDYISKPVKQHDLITRVRVGTRMWTMHDQLHKAAITDGLTRLYNHDHFNRLLEQEMGRSRRYGHCVSMIMVDLDHFKAINDTFGHLVGNATLEEVARIIREGIRDVDLAARFGGEEFAIILPEITARDAGQVAERIRWTLSTSLRLEPLQSHAVTASFGIADSDDPRVQSAADLVDLADRALYMAKHTGRDQVACCHDLDEVAEFKETIETDELDRLRRRLTTLSLRAKDVYMQSVKSLLQALDEKDPYTTRHSVNVAFYAHRIAEQMGCSRATAKSVFNAALLHDIGKVGVPDRILMKRTPLTQIEKMVMEQVPIIGTRVVDHLRILESEIQIIRHQREYYDGSGIPSGLVGTQIPIGSRILLVADAFDAMTTDRVYRRRRPVDEVVIEIQRLGGQQFDPRAALALRQAVEQQRDEWEARIVDTLDAMRLPASSPLDNLTDALGNGTPSTLSSAWEACATEPSDPDHSHT